MKVNRSINKYARDILSEADEFELRSFMMSRLQKDDELQILFVSRFSDHLELEEQDRYEFIFFKALQAVKKGSTILGYHKQSRLSLIYRELGEQVKDSTAIKNYIKAYAILKHGLIFLRLVFSKEKQYNDKLVDIKLWYIDLLSALIILKPSPQLLMEILSFVEDEVQNQAYISLDKHINLYDIMHKLHIMLNREEISFELAGSIRSDEEKRPNNRIHYLLCLFRNYDSKVIIQHKSVLELASSEWYNILIELLSIAQNRKCYELITGFDIITESIRYRHIRLAKLCLEILIINERWDQAGNLNEQILTTDLPKQLYTKYYEHFPVQVGKLVKAAIQVNRLNNLNKLSLYGILNDQLEIRQHLIKAELSDHLIPFLYLLDQEYLDEARSIIFEKISAECSELFGIPLRDKVNHYKSLFAKFEDADMLDALDGIIQKTGRPKSLLS